ncbi:MAG: serine/threonine protein kinase [Acidobacteriota bacterium]|nr:serine/threonine protein kinase [Acidobacteriota bacterium]
MLTPDTILQNRYRIIRQLGKGGMGTVYEAADERLDTIVALKESHFDDERLRKQFEREARLLARLRHPAMTRVIDHFIEGDGQFLVMDFIAGEDLYEMLQRKGGAFPPDKVLDWADQLLDALDYLHSQDPPVIHRDIKPQNLKLTERNQIILLDFGLAKGFASQLSRVTPSGSIFGYTPNYAPLEQIQGTGTDPRSDLYSLAATLYHLMTNVTPPDVLTRASAVIGKRRDPLRAANDVNPQVSASVASVLTQAMEIDRDPRPSTAADMRKALRDATRPLANDVSEPETLLLPTVVDTPSIQKQQEIISTIASPPALRENTPPVAQKQSSNLSPQLIPKPRRKMLTISGVLALLVLSIIIAAVAWNSSASVDGFHINVIYIPQRETDAKKVANRLRKLGAEVDLVLKQDATYASYDGKIIHAKNDLNAAQKVSDSISDIEKFSLEGAESYNDKQLSIWIMK